MTMRSVRFVRRLSLLAGIFAAGIALASTLPRLPRDLVLPQTGDSPAPVTFSHVSHVDEARPGCLGCHPRLFRILEPGRTRSGEAISHKLMESGGACGACHGKSAFALDSCDLCHK